VVAPLQDRKGTKKEGREGKEGKAGKRIEEKGDGHEGKERGITVFSHSQP